MSFLSLQGVHKGFGAGRARTDVLRDINLEVAEGEFLAIVGYSGSGKTTLINLIAGLTRPDQGTVTLAGNPITEPGPNRGIVFQNYSLLPWLSVAENIALAVDAVFPAWPAAKRAEHVAKFIAMVNLTPARDKKPHELSGGMRQRVSVARALAMDPRMLLLDEPLGALDALTRATLQQEIGQIARQAGKTVLLITNDVDEALLLADRIVPLTPGPGATLGPAFLVDKPKERNRHLINHDPDFKRLRARIIEFLLGCNEQRRLVVTKKLVLPDLEPEDLTVRGPVWIGKPRPRRKNTLRREEVAVNR